MLKTHFGFVGNNYAISISSVAKNNLDKIIVVPIIGFEILGNYALALQFYAVFMIFSKVVYQYTLPHDSVGQTTTKAKVIALILSVIITVLGITITPFIMPIIFPEYNEAIIAIQIISLAVIPSTVGLILTSGFLGNENSKIVLSGRIMFVITIITLIVILTPIYGIVGIASSFVIASIIQSILFVCYKLKKDF